MFGGNQPQGFTIIEILIFLTVSGLLFLSVLNLISNDQNKTDFSQGTHEFFSQIQDLTNNVQIGYYNTAGNFTCTYPGGAGSTPSISLLTTQEQGANYGCTYIGRVLLFAPGNKTSQYTVDTVVGRQFNPAPPTPATLVNNITAADPYDLSGGTNASLGLTTVNLPPGLVVSQVSYTDNYFGLGTTKQYDTLIGFFSSFPGGTTSSPTSGSLSSSLIPVPSNKNPTSLVTGYVPGVIDPNQVPIYVSSMQNDGTTNKVFSTAASLGCQSPNPCTIMNPTGGVQICLQSTGLSKTYAIITIGGNSSSGNASGNPLSTQLKVYQGSKCP
jgi:hypothetical protein